MADVAGLSNISKLYLFNTNISDKGITHLQSLTQLAYLNLVATKVSVQGLLALKKLPALRSMFLYKTNMKKEDWPLLKTSFPKAIIDSGGYLVPTLQSDTTLLKAEKNY